MSLSLVTVFTLFGPTHFQRNAYFTGTTTDVYKNEIAGNHIQLKLLDSLPDTTEP